MIPRFGPSPDSSYPHRRRPGAYAILAREGRILLTHQQSPVPEFQLPGGGIDAGEQPVAALHREVFEETGWTISAPRRLSTYRRFCFMPEYKLYAEKICSIFVARPIQRLGPPSEAGHSAHWFTPADALDALEDPGSRAMLRLFLRRGF